MATPEPVFDAYLIVDWSAGSRPKTGADSIWIGSVVRSAHGALVETPPVNPPTRTAAMKWLRGRLSDLTGRGLAVLLGFDFAFGYPAGFAARVAPGQADWRGTWTTLAERIDDADDNANNRFAVAADLNRAIAAAPFPFWGCPEVHAGPWLRPTRPDGYGKADGGDADGGLTERRRCDAVRRGPQPVWKLAYAGSVGSQSLLGIARLAGLRADPRLGDRLCIWPFETGLGPVRRCPGTVVIAEVYPSLLPVAPRTDQPKDALQVSALARHLARCDAAGMLARAFAGPAGLTATGRRAIEAEEGWILGIDGSLGAAPPAAGGRP